jgi:hypothetical protein
MNKAESISAPGERALQIDDEHGPETEKYSGSTRVAILAIGSLLSWTPLLTVWLLSGH